MPFSNFMPIGWVGRVTTLVNCAIWVVIKKSSLFNIYIILNIRSPAGIRSRFLLHPVYDVYDRVTYWSYNILIRGNVPVGISLNHLKSLIFCQSFFKNYNRFRPITDNPVVDQSPAEKGCVIATKNSYYSILRLKVWWWQKNVKLLFFF